MMNKYRFKDRLPEETLEAVQLNKENVTEVAKWCRGIEVVEHDAVKPENTYVGINLMTFGGPTRAGEGDYVVLDRIGNFHVLLSHVFESTIEPINE